MLPRPRSQPRPAGRRCRWIVNAVARRPPRLRPQDLQALVVNSHSEIEALRAAQRETDKARQDSVLVATSTAATRQTKLDEFKAEISRLEAQGQTVAGLQVEKISTLGQVKVLAHALRCRLRGGEREHGP